MRLDGAKSAVPYVHPRLAAITLAGDEDEPIRHVFEWAAPEPLQRHLEKTDPPKSGFRASANGAWRLWSIVPVFPRSGCAVRLGKACGAVSAVLGAF